MSRGPDARTRMGMAHRRGRVKEAAQLRGEGWACRDIAWKIGVSEPTARMYVIEGAGLALFNAPVDPEKKRLWKPSPPRRPRPGNNQERMPAETMMRRRAAKDWRSAILIVRGEKALAEKWLCARAAEDWRNARLAAREKARAERKAEMFARWASWYAERQQREASRPPKLSREQLERRVRDAEILLALDVDRRERWREDDALLLGDPAAAWRDAMAKAKAERRQRERAQRRYRWREIPPQTVSLDYKSDENFSRHELLGGRVEDDPFTILTGSGADHMNELLGDLSIEDVARMDEWQLESLRRRITDAGLAPRSVQRGERERLQVITPHRGEAPAPKRARKSSRHRGRNEASQLMSGRGKKFKRVNSQPRDGWGGVVLPDEEAPA